MRIKIRKALPEDISRILDITAKARAYMRSTGNMHQWVNGYPDADLIRSDIERGWCRVMTADNRIFATFCMMTEPEPSYSTIEDGPGWIDDNHPYITLHRMASDGSVSGVFRRAVDYAAAHCGNLRADTHADNKTMLNAMVREGFTRCGTVRLADGSLRTAFQRMGPGVDEWQKRLSGIADPCKRTILMRFFKTGPGEYGEGDRFIGVNVPDNRRISRRYATLPLAEILKMLESDIHEYRLGALLALVEKYRLSRTQEERDRVVDFYLAHCHRANNWDLVDLSCEHILGPEISEGRRLDALEELVASGNLWRERVAVVSMLWPIRASQLELPLAIAKRMLGHPHSLINKAVGWILREAGKKDAEALRGFLRENVGAMPSVTLSYATERLSPEERSAWRKKRTEANASLR